MTEHVVWSIDGTGALNVTSGVGTAAVYSWPDHLTPPDDGAAGVREPRRPHPSPLAPAAAVVLP